MLATKRDPDIIRDLANVEVYIAVFEQGNMSFAAKALNCSQPMISTRIKNMETVLGTRLLIRKHKGLLFTTEGKALYDIMKRCKISIQQADNRLEKMKEKRFSFTFGISSTLAGHVLPRCLHGMQSVVDTELFFKDDRSEHIIDGVYEESIDMAIVDSKQVREGMAQHDWLKDEIVLFSREPLSHNIDPKALKTLSFIFYTKRSYMNSHIEDLFQRSHIQKPLLESLCHLDDIIAVKEAILHHPKHDGRQLVSWIPKSAIEDELASNRLYSSRIGGDIMEYPLYLLYKQERSLDPTFIKLIEHLEKV